MKNITKNLVPIRPDRNFPRREPSRKNKYPINKKMSNSKLFHLSLMTLFCHSGVLIADLDQLLVGA